MYRGQVENFPIVCMIYCMYTHFAQDFVKSLFQVLLHTSVYFYWPTESTFDRDMLEKIQEARYTMDE